ncbi:DUF3000 domain-containing protein [Mycetocola reblochoni]|uniref:Uncharacterized protein Q1 colocalized with Q n=2 Tax=Mycetocola reblochoni TaxID=331618 RepID=A0A1R4K724_9MICO|nr:DUF3000 domain-containing protein [Mycetocola reblochoni]RLP67971.1 DUF3000 domain-containing protein [Mycetocola reblochoni]SJN40004.1 Uncharacterized protein Q1 colocalized with Q [Mycetocola reblochoni REB411]
MAEESENADTPVEFARARDAIRSATVRDELRVTEIPAPGSLAPYAIAFAADVGDVGHEDDSPDGTGRFVLLYDPEQPEAWDGPYRVVCFAQAPLETEIGIDPFIADVTWSWLIDALGSRGAQYAHPSGTATKIISSGFGELGGEPDGAQIELRASWSPLTADVGSQFEAWGELLCMLAGLPPSSEGVTVLRRKGPRA